MAIHPNDTLGLKLWAIYEALGGDPNAEPDSSDLLGWFLDKLAIQLSFGGIGGGSGGGYSPPSTGIPKAHLAADIQSSLGKAETAIQSETDPKYTADKPTIALKSELADLASKSEIPDVSNLALKSELPSLSGLATESYVNQAVQGVQVDTTGLATEQYVDNAIQAVNDFDPTGLATEVYVDSVVSGKMNQVEDSLEGNISVFDDTGAIEDSGVAIDDIATKQQVADAVQGMAGFDPSGLATEQYVDDSIANIQAIDLSGLASESYVDSKVASVDLTGYATKQYVDDELEGMVEEDPVYSADKPGLAFKIDLPQKLSDLTDDSDFVNENLVTNKVDTHNITPNAHGDIRLAVTTEAQNRVAAMQAHDESANTHTDIRDTLLSLIGLPTYNNNTHKITFTAQNGATLIIDLPIESLAANVDFDSTTKEIILTLQNGSEKRIDVSALIKEYAGLSNAYIQLSINNHNEIEATLLDGSIGESKLSSTLLAKLNGKAEKVVGAINGNFVGLGADGNLTDSGKSGEDFATATQGEKADSAYQKPVSGIPQSDLASVVQNKLNKTGIYTTVLPLNGATFINYNDIIGRSVSTPDIGDSILSADDGVIVEITSTQQYGHGVQYRGCLKGSKGADGSQGIQGANGSNGANGVDGATGVRGRRIFASSNSSAITNISQISGCEVGDFIINTYTSAKTILGVSRTVGTLVEVTSATAGSDAGNIRGVAGATGATGQAGAQFSLSGSILTVSI